jgi:hypothetical protein
MLIVKKVPIDVNNVHFIEKGKIDGNFLMNTQAIVQLIADIRLLY